MKKTIYISIVTILFVPIFLLKAEDAININTTVQATSAVRMRAEVRADIKNERMEMKKEIKDKHQEMKADLKVKVDARRVELKANIDAMKTKNKDERAKKLDEKAKARVEVRLNNIYKKLTERVSRLSQVDSEITRRLTQYATSGVSVVSVTTLQTPAQALLAKAKIDVEATKTISEAELNATTTKETLRAVVATAEKSIKTAAESYKKVLDALKALPKVKVKATL